MVYPKMGVNYRMPLATTKPRPTRISNLRHSAWLPSPELFMGGRPQAASLVQGLRPRNAPPWLANMLFLSRHDVYYYVSSQRYFPLPVRQRQAPCLHCVPPKRRPSRNGQAFCMPCISPRAGN